MIKKLALSILIAAALCLGAKPVTLVERLVKAQAGLLAPREPKTDPEALARAIDKAANGDRILSAALLATAYAETALSDRLRRNECRKDECDARRAWGLFQIHKDGNTADVWGSPDVDVQATAAARKMKSAFYTAKAEHAPFPLGMFRIYGGRRATASIPREEVRVKTFNQVLGHL